MIYRTHDWPDGEHKEFAKARYPSGSPMGVSSPRYPVNWARHGYSVWQTTSSATVPDLRERRHGRLGKPREDHSALTPLGVPRVPDAHAFRRRPSPHRAPGQAAWTRASVCGAHRSTPADGKGSSMVPLRPCMEPPQPPRGTLGQSESSSRRSRANTANSSPPRARQSSSRSTDAIRSDRLEHGIASVPY